MNNRIISATALIIIFLAVLSSGFAGQAFPVHEVAAASQPLNNVEIQVQQTNSSLTSYYLTVYNSSGYPVISSSSQYPGFGAMLPSAAYLFVVTATLQYPYCCPVTYATGSASSGSVSPPAATNESSTGSSTVYPINYPPVEYGYAMKQISSATSFTIQTSSITNLATYDVTAHVSYANGTAASGAYVQASIVGSYYYLPTANWVMWGQTGSDGSFTLKVPSLPVEVYAYSSVFVNLPKSLTTYTTTMGGEMVNVTIYWQPTYVYLEGFALVLPPKATANITLHVQQPRYYVTPYSPGQPTPEIQSVKTTTTVTAGGTQGNQPSGPTNQPQIIPPFSSETAISQSTSGSYFGSPSEQLLLAITIAAVVIAAFSVIFALRRKPETGR